MYESSDKQPPSILYFIVNNKGFVMVLISSNKHFFVFYQKQFGNPPPRFVWTIVETNLSIQFIQSACFQAEVSILTSSKHQILNRN